MKTYEVIADLCKKNNIAITALESELGFGRGSIGKLRNSSTSVERMQKIADYFEVPLEYLVNGEMPSTVQKEPALYGKRLFKAKLKDGEVEEYLPEAEAELLEKMRYLEPEQFELIKNMIAQLAEKNIDK